MQHNLATPTRKLLIEWDVRSQVAFTLRNVDENKVSNVIENLSRMVVRLEPWVEVINRAIVHLAPLIEAVFRASKYFAQFAGVAKQFYEDELVAIKCKERGLVPHGIILDHSKLLFDYKNQDFRQILATNWPVLHGRIKFGQRLLLNDNRLSIMWRQMLVAHESCLYEAVRSTAVTTIERAVNLTRIRNDRSRCGEWLEGTIGNLPVSALGGYRGVRIFELLIKEVFAPCRGDKSINTKYMNRHAVAHGIGNSPASVIDSLNAILLAHFVICACEQVKRQREYS